MCGLSNVQMTSEHVRQDWVNTAWGSAPQTLLFVEVEVERLIRSTPQTRTAVFRGGVQLTLLSPRTIASMGRPGHVLLRMHSHTSNGVMSLHATG